MATYAIGDIQGCLESLVRLLDRIQFDPTEDELWLVGDLVNRGPDSLGVLRWAKRHEEHIRCVLGNHDLHLFERAHGAPAKARDTLSPILEADDRDELLDWLAAQPLLRRSGRYVVMHAGLDPSWSLEEAEQRAREVERMLQSSDRGAFARALRGKASASETDWDDAWGDRSRIRETVAVLTRIRMVDEQGRPSYGFTGPPDKAPDGQRPWFEIPTPEWRSNDDEPICVFGHWAALGLRVEPGFIALDSGCVWGNALTAVRLKDRRVFQEECTRS